MSGRGGDAPLPNGGEFLLQLLRNNQSDSVHPIFPPPPQQQQTFSQDPAVAAVGPTIPTFPPPHAAFPPSNGADFAFPPWSHLPPLPFTQQNYFPQNPNPNPNFTSTPSRPPQFDLHLRRVSPGDGARNLGLYGDKSNPSAPNQPGQNLIFGSLNQDVLKNGAVNDLEPSFYRAAENRFPQSSIEANSSVLRAQTLERSRNSNDRLQQGDSGRVAAPPPGFSSNFKNVRPVGHGYGRGTPDLNGDKGKGNAAPSYKSDRLINQLDSPGLPAGSSLHSASNFDIEESIKQRSAGDGEESRRTGEDKANNDGSEIDVLDDLVDSLGIEDQSAEKNGKKKHIRDKVTSFSVHLCV